MNNELVSTPVIPIKRRAASGSAPAAWRDRAATATALRLLEGLAIGRLEMRLPDGSLRVFEGSQTDRPGAHIAIHDLRALRRLLTAGDLGLAETYMDGLWDTPDLMALLELGSRNQEHWNATLRGGWLARAANRLYHRRRDNSRRGSRRNIADHYDLGNAFYAQWLDPSMSYSSGLYTSPEQSAEQAQANKYRRIAELAGLEPTHRILEIGCGWGGFMAHAASEIGCRVDGITLSREQLAYANQRMADQGLAQRARASLIDYRDTTSEYDAVVSIEMLEAVGERHWPTYFRTLRERLKPGASAVLQVITIAEQRFEAYRRNADFIQRHVFPRGMLPSPSTLRRHARAAGLQPDHAQTFGASYARTLSEWRRDFNAAWPKLARLGFDERFRRLWDYYLCYCETGFRAGSIDVGIYRLRRSA